MWTVSLICGEFSVVTSYFEFVPVFVYVYGFVCDDCLFRPQSDCDARTGVLVYSGS